MKPLADPETKAFKLRFSVTIAGICIVVVAMSLGVQGFRKDFLTSALVVILSLLAVAWTLRRFPWALADEVVDEGGQLRIKRGAARIAVGFGEIVGVERDDGGVSERLVRLKLSKTTALGTEIVFRPMGYRSITLKELDELIAGLRLRTASAVPAAESDRATNAARRRGRLARLPLSLRQALLGCAVIFLLASVVNDLLGLGFYSPSRKGAAVALIVCLLAFYLFGPTRDEIDKRIDARRERAASGQVSE